MEGFSEILTPEGTVKYKMVGEGTVLKIEFGKDDKVIIYVPYNRELIKKMRTISGRRWNPQGRYWEVPHEEGLITKLVVDPYFYLIPLQMELSIRTITA